VSLNEPRVINTIADYARLRNFNVTASPGAYAAVGLNAQVVFHGIFLQSNKERWFLKVLSMCSNSGYNRIKKPCLMFLTAVSRTPHTPVLPTSLHSVTNDERIFSFFSKQFRSLSFFCLLLAHFWTSRKEWKRSINFPLLSEGSLTCSQKSFTGLYPEPDEWNTLSQ
jgi:hypothetical protein